MVLDHLLVLHARHTEPNKTIERQLLANGKGLSVRMGLKESGWQSCEPTNRNHIRGLALG
ncbi:hypothetical protein DC094_11425 [Pelagibaculum spongiae]|uniref:Uncharacterized protein n=1 Tax=Pelagibaculum spongiae TaxID=2080658 RepID=A0A2V1GTD1_9GAMM|nr:hypothetical protein DC094_11425 [Pelagibaculum spongiae]